MEFIDKLIAGVAPSFAVDRMRAKLAIKAYYEASRPSRTRTNKSDNSGSKTLTDASASTLRGQARHLDQNHDLAKGILRELVNKTAGSKGVQVESLARGTDGKIAIDFTRKLNDLWQDWCEVCDVSDEGSFRQMQRSLLHSKYRDGESFNRFLTGRVSGLTHGTGVPFSIQAFEADFVPFVDDPSRGIYQGIKRNDWGAAVDFLVAKNHPAESFQTQFMEVPASLMCHAKVVERIGQSRGVSIFASVLNRLNDLKDYEDTERVAAKISASMAAYIKKGDSTLYDDDPDEDRSIQIESGMVFDGLSAGEDVGTIQSNRPSQLLQPFRDSMLKAISTGTGAGYSAISNDYSGSYSSQRQQLVDNWITYDVLQDQAISELIRPTFRKFVQMAIASGMIATNGIDRATVYDADYRAPVMPWIDPKKEAEAHLVKLAAGLTSPQKVMRQGGERPQEVLDQTKAFIEMLDKLGLQQPEYLTETQNPAEN